MISIESDPFVVTLLLYYLPFDRYLFVESTILALFKEGQLHRAAIEKHTLADKLAAIPSVLGSAMLEVFQSFAQFSGDTISGRSKNIITGTMGAGI